MDGLGTITGAWGVEWGEHMPGVQTFMLKCLKLLHNAAAVTLLKL